MYYIGKKIDDELTIYYSVINNKVYSFCAFSVFIEDDLKESIKESTKGIEEAIKQIPIKGIYIFKHGEINSITITDKGIADKIGNYRIPSEKEIKKIIDFLNEVKEIRIEETFDLWEEL